MMTIMDRSVLYQINSLEKPQKISGFLKEKGYSRQNLVDLRKNEQAICLNGTYVHMNHMLAEGCSDGMDSGNGKFRTDPSGKTAVCHRL